METEEIYKKASELHKTYKGKAQIISKVPFRGYEDLAYYYTRGACSLYHPSVGLIKA